MMIGHGFNVAIVDWTVAEPASLAVRRAVFTAEQGIPADLETDGHDAGARHCVVTTGDGRPVATGRLLPNGHIGRIATLAHLRSQGIGAAVLNRLMDEARALGLAKVTLHAQKRAVRFYERHGFVSVGPGFEEAGIEHQAMECSLN